MQNEHFIAGKDASLESTIQTLQDRLQALGFQVEEQSWLHPVEAIWSVHLRDRDCPLLYTNGKGASELAARASALGEFFERMSSNYFWTHHYLGAGRAELPFVHFPQERWFPLDDDTAWPQALLTPELQSFYNPDDGVEPAMLVDLNSGNDERGICALPYTRLRDGAQIWFPVNITANLYVSNGMAAGNTPTETRAQALSEIFERHVKFRVIAEGLCLPEVPEEVIARYPRVAADIAALRAAGFGILVRDASLGGRFPVMNVTLLNPRDQGCFASFGAHPRFEIALERALTELLQGRALDQLDGFPAPVFDLDDVASAPNLESHFVDSTGTIGWRFFSETADFEFCDWNFTHTTQEDCDWLVEHIHAEGFDVYLAEYTHLGVYACRILVPGMSEIYPVDDLEWENNSVGNLLRPFLDDLPALSDEECAELYELLEELNLDDQRSVATLIGLAADPDSAWESLRVGELKALLALALGDEEAIREGCGWVTGFAQLDDARLRVYRCIENLLDFENADDYAAALTLLYGEEVLDQADALLSGEDRFFGLVRLGGNYEGSALHQQLLAAYDKVQSRKTA